MRKLLGYLSQFASFSGQGELLCTRSLEYLLKEDAKARSVFAKVLSSALSTSINDQLFWRAEFPQDDRGRPDLEGCLADETPLVKVEAKLGAPFGEGQLSSYMAELTKRNCQRCLVVLVPRRRCAEASEYTKSKFALKGDGPWRYGNVRLAVVAWEEVFQSLEEVTGQVFCDDLSQLHSMYRALNGDDMEPLTTDEEVLAWREKETWWNNLIDLTTRQLASPGSRLLPLRIEKSEVQYYLRYVCRNVQGDESCYSIGTRDPFENHTTPIWFRFHKDTKSFQSIAMELEKSPFLGQMVRSSGHIWFPLEVPRNAGRNEMINELVDQVTEITSVAYRFID